MEQWQYEVTSGGRIWYCIDGRSETLLLAAVTAWCGAWLLCAVTSRLHLRAAR